MRLDNWSCYVSENKDWERSGSCGCGDSFMVVSEKCVDFRSIEEGLELAEREKRFRVAVEMGERCVE